MFLAFVKLTLSQLPRLETWGSDFSCSSPLPSTSDQSLNSFLNYCLCWLTPSPILSSTNSRSTWPPGKPFYNAIAIMLHIFQWLLCARTSKRAKPFKRQSLSQSWNVFLAISPSSISILLCHHCSHEHKAVQEIFWINISGSYSHRSIFFLIMQDPQVSG